MAVIRQLNILGQMRLDVPHIRSLESSVAADFDLLAGKIMAGQKPLVVHGFSLDGSIGVAATGLKVNVAGSLLLHPLASEAGTILAVDDDALPETLAPTNDNVLGSFVAGQDNFIGIDLIRESDDTTTDTVMFLDANTRVETPRSIPLARTLSYKIVISTTDFSATPHICPVAKVSLNNLGNVDGITDCRPMAFRLGAGGSVPDNQNTYTWPQGRTADQNNAFTGGDKDIASEKEWRDAIMTRLWELGGGERWYSPTSDRDVKLAFGTSVLPNTKNFDWDAEDEILKWKGLSVIFANSAATSNTINNNTDGVELLDGHCLYVDIDRSSQDAALEPVVSSLAALGAPAVPGSRIIVAWRKGTQVFVRDYPFEVTRDLTGIQTPTGEYAKALFQGTTPGTYVWKQVEPFVAGDVGHVQFDSGEGMAGSDKFFWDNENECLGIGNSAPTVALDVTGAGKFSSSLEADSANITNQIQAGSVDSSGKVQGSYLFADGGTGPVGGLFGADGRIQATGYLQSSCGVVYVGSTSDNWSIANSSPNTSSGADLNFSLGGEAKLSIDSGSHLTIGDAASANNPSIRLQKSGHSASIFTDTSGRLYLHTSPSTDISINYTGNSKTLLGASNSGPVLIGTNTQSAGAKLTVGGDVYGNGYIHADGYVQAGSCLQSNSGEVYVGSSSDSWLIASNDTSPYTNDLIFSLGYKQDGSRNVLAYIAYDHPTTGVKLQNFTGQHRTVAEPVSEALANESIGLICCSAGGYAQDGKIVTPKEGVSINESLPSVRLSSKRLEKNVFGVISGAEDPESPTRQYVHGNFVSVFEKAKDDNRIIINSVGEGAVWVCNANGPLENGDYITTSEVPGHGMKQDDDLLHNYTVAKITMDCDFDPKNDEYEVVEFTHNGKKYKKAFVGCTYHCG